MENHVNNYFVLHRVAGFLNHFLDDHYMAECEQLSKNDVQFIFRQRGVQKAVKFYLGEESFLFFPDKYSTSKKSIAIFKALENRKFLKAIVHAHDRSFRMHFSDDFCLVILLYGRNANMLLYQHNTLIFSLNPNIKTHTDKPLSYFKNISRATENDFIKTVEDAGIKKAVSTHFPGFTKGILANFEWNKFSDASPQTQYSKLKAWENELLKTGFHIYTAEKMPGQKQAFLSLLKPETEAFFTDDIYEALNEFAREYFKISQFNAQRNKLIQNLKSKIDRQEGQLRSYYQHLEKLETDKNYKHQADLLMANLHNIPKGVDKIELPDFDGSRKVNIKLKRDVSAQEWAEKLYQKAKKQQIERGQTETHISAIEKMLIELKTKLQQAENAQDTKELRVLAPQETQAKNILKKQEAVPYKKFEIDGFNVLVGKSAADNDKLSFGVAKKDDTWLHAKDVAGSHVVIQNPSKKEIQKQTLEKAAQLAAYFSKGKGSNLFPVAYTLKKFVRKPKGAGAGKVIVDKEKVLIVEPKIPI